MPTRSLPNTSTSRPTSRKSSIQILYFTLRGIINLFGFITKLYELILKASTEITYNVKWLE
jgi:hypothetical protein